MQRSVGLMFAVVGAASLGLAAAWGAEVELIRLTYQADGECPSEARFIEGLEGRTRLARIVPNASALRSFSVSVWLTDEGQYAGTLEVKDESQSVAVRELRGESCAGVVDGLALAAALAIDPHASFEPVASPVGSAPAAPSSHRPPAAKTVQHQQPPAAKTAHLHRQPPPSVRRWNALWQTATIAGPASRLLVGPGVFAELEIQTGQWLSPAFRWGLLAAQTGLIGPADDRARFTWFSTRLEGCPRAFWLHPDVSLRPCILADLGITRAHGIAVAKPQTATGLWASVGLTVQARYTWRQQLFIELEAGGTAPLRRDQFLFLHPTIQVYEAPVVGGVAALGFGVALQ